MPDANLGPPLSEDVLDVAARRYVIDTESASAIARDLGVPERTMRGWARRRRWPQLRRFYVAARRDAARDIAALVAASDADLLEAAAIGRLLREATPDALRELRRALGVVG